ncbi:MAG: ATP-binding protein, partial [Gemmatimonadota bacterium]
ETDAGHGGAPRLGPRPAAIVPLNSPDGAIAVLTLLAPAGRPYRSVDLSLAEELAARATLALEKARLYDEARRATRVRDEMLAVVSHDLRNPLNTIAMSADLLAESLPADVDVARVQLEIIDRSVRRADRLIADLLDVARLESGTLAIEPGPVASVEVAREALALHRAQADAGELQLIDEVPDRLPHVWADRDRLLQVFGNLIGNAIKFTPEGGRITVGAEPVDGRVRFRISDTGPGMPPDHLSRLFDPFWQATRRRGGAGLGLAISRGIVEAHGGRIRAESAPGGGTTISFTIPVAEGGRGAGARDVPRRSPDRAAN